MKTRFQSLFESLANWKGITLFAVLEVVFNLFVLRAIDPKSGLATQSLIFDLRLWYTPAEIVRTLALYTLAQRRAAALGHLTIDVLYPLVYGTLFSLLIIALYRSRLAAPQRHRLLLLPWLTVLVDYAENIALAALFLSYPSLLPALAVLTPYLTVLKWTLIALTGLTALWGLLLLIFFPGKEDSL